MRAARALLATLVVSAALFVPALAAPAPAAAAEPDALVSIELTGFTPTLPARDGEITVSGEVTNTSKDRIERPRAYFWRNQAPITTTEGFQQALDSDSNDPLGARYISNDDDGTFADLYTDKKPYLEPGADADFTIRVKVADLALAPTSGVYLMGVHVLQNEQPLAVGRARVFVPILSSAPRNTLQMTSVVTLNSRPSLVRKGVFVDDHLAEEIKPGGRLDVLLRVADRPDTTFAVDPALVEELQTMKGGYQVLDDDDKTEDGPGSGDAERWLDTFSRLLSTRDGYRLPYGSVDLAALTHARHADIVAASTASSGSVSATASLPLLVWPRGGNADLETMEAADRLEPAAVLLSDRTTKTSSPLLQGLGAAPIVNYTSAAFAGGPGPDPSDTPVHLQQRLLAESWIQASTEPAGTTLGRVRVISTVAQAQGDDESIKAPWVQQTTLTQLLRSTPAKWSENLEYTDSMRSKELDASRMSELNQLARSTTTWQDLLVDPSSVKGATEAGLARAASVRGGSADSFSTYVEAQQRDLDSRLNAVQISATPKVLTPKSRVSFPITIRNTLPSSGEPDDVSTNAVRVQLRFSSANSQRLSVPPLELRTIAPEDNFQGSAVVEAKTNGTVRVTAQLYTASGQAVGRPFPIDITATQAGTVGWFIAIGAGIVLVGTTALRIRQVTRERARTAAAEEAEQLDATRSAPASDTSSADTSASIDV